MVPQHLNSSFVNMLVFCRHSGLSQQAAERFWSTKFGDPSVRKDQVDAVNRNGDPIGKARLFRSGVAGQCFFLPNKASSSKACNVLQVR